MHWSEIASMSMVKRNQQNYSAVSDLLHMGALANLTPEAIYCHRTAETTPEWPSQHVELKHEHARSHSIASHPESDVMLRYVCSCVVNMLQVFRVLSPLHD